METLKFVYLGKNNEFGVDQISLVLIKDSSIVKTLLTHLVELPELIDWFMKSIEYIKHELLPINTGSQSISHAIYTFYDDIDDDYEDDELLDCMYEYRRHHGLRFGMRGTDIPDIYFGKKGNFYEVSLYSGKENWSYCFSLEELYESIIELKRFA